MPITHYQQDLDNHPVPLKTETVIALPPPALGTGVRIPGAVHLQLHFRYSDNNFTNLFKCCISL